MNVLITGIGGPTPRSIAKAIRFRRPDIRIIGIDSNRNAIGFYVPGLVDRHYQVPQATAPDYWEFVRRILEVEKIDKAFVQPEMEVVEWGRYYEENNEFPCPVLIPPVKLAECLVDKSLMSNILRGTDFIPKTIKISHDNPCFNKVKNDIGYPCWIRATKGSGGLGSLKIPDQNTLRSWLLINHEISEFTISEYLPGRHLANQMLYFNGDYLKGTSLECVEYVMASIAPSRITGNTSYGRFLNEDNILKFCHQALLQICKKLNATPHGVFSFDLKEDSQKRLKITEVNIRHMAYTGIMAKLGFDLIHDTIQLLDEGIEAITPKPFFHFEKPFAFLRDVDIEPIILPEILLTH